MDGAANGLRGIVGDVEVNSGRNLLAQHRQQVLDVVDHFDRICAGLPLNGEHHAADIVEPCDRLIVLDAVDDASQLFQPDRIAVFPGDDDGAVRRGVRQLTVRLHRERLFLTV